MKNIPITILFMLLSASTLCGQDPPSAPPSAPPSDPPSAPPSDPPSAPPSDPPSDPPPDTPAEKADASTEKQSGGFLDAFYESLFGTSKAKTVEEGHTHAAVESETDIEIMLEDDPSNPKSKTDAQPKRIGLLDDFEEAIKQSQLEQRPLLLIAGADWCTWCRKLEKELEQSDAEPILTKWIVVKIDVDASPGLAEEFEVSSLPALRVLSADRRVAAKREGYMPLSELQTWLEEAAPQVDPSITRVLYETTTPDEEQLAKLIDFLGNRSPSLRQSATRRLIESRAVSAKPVIALLGNGRLAQRLCAVDILRNWGAPVDGLDPWEPNSISTQHIDDLQTWTESHPAPANDATEPATETPVDPEKIKDAITRLLLDPETKRRSLLSEIIGYGKAVVPELRTRLENAAELNDSQRTQLRQLLLSSLASGKTRGEHSNLLTALASLNPDTHRKAASKLFEVVDADDRGLVDELAQDVDPLVRESAVPALQRIGLLQEPERLQKLLSDKSPSVRTAVLRELAENPQAESIALLSRHASQETDEDLLVYTAKTLGELLEEKGVEETLCGLAQNASWRVRAAALDAFSQRAEHRYDFSTPVVSAKVFDSVLSATEDKDAFVMKRATELLPKLMSTSNAKTVVGFLTKRPGAIDEFWTSLSDHEKSTISLPLSNAAVTFLESQDPAQVGSATALLTKINPDSLKHQLPNLLTSVHSQVRIAALKGTVAFMESMRNEQLKTMSAVSERATDEVPREPWYPVPESFLTVPTPPAPAASNENEADQTDTALPAATEAEPSTPIPASLAAVDDFFGGQPVTPANKNGEAETSTPPPLPTPPISALQNDLNLADGLFGEPVKNQAVAVDANAEPSSDHKAVLDRNKLLSTWLVDWCAQYDAEGGLETVESLRRLLRETWTSLAGSTLDQDAASEQQVEMTWLALANLASGRGEVAKQLAIPELLAPLNARPDSKIDSKPVALQILPWLPADLVLASIKDYQLKWQGDFSEDDKALLKSVTIFENHDVAKWLLDNVGSHSLSSSQFVIASEFFIRALRGEHNRSAALQLAGDALRGEPPFRNYAKQAIGSRSALVWLDQQRVRDLSAEQRALLLSALHSFDYSRGSQSAVGRVAAAAKWDREVEIAAMIALAAEPQIAVDRAIQWLEHPVREVQLMSLDRLANSSNDFMKKSWQLGITITQHGADDDVPLFFLAVRPMPIELLDNLMKDPDSDIGWQAYMLLLANGKEALSQWKEDELDAEQLLTIAAALVKAQRVDDEAIKFYHRVNVGIESYRKQTLIQLLSGLPGAEVKALKRRIQASVRYPFGSTF